MPGFGNRLIHTIFVLGKNNKPEVNKCNGHVGKTEWVDNFEGTVYCAELPDDTDHVLFVRRNGKSVWCGNSVTEHSCFSFAIEGVSRVFTAEMNRHRAGWAISEGSLRYIRFDKDLTWWLPNSLRVNESDDDDLKQRKLESQRVFNEAFSHQEKCYGELLQIWDMNDKDKNFDYKKKVTSCLRRIVGMGVATGGVWTGNVRALRHVLTLRASAHAEEEILHVFSKVAAKMKEEEPLLFGDFVEDENGFWRPKYVKV
jgi:thymidylate synthase (FAD)